MHNIVVISGGTDAYSETFIRAHIERLPAVVKPLYGWPPLSNGHEIVSQFPSLREHVRRAVLRRMGFWTFEGAITDELVRFFKRNNIKAVLAEYGPTGVRVMESCRRAGVPLVVHFHGFDAYCHATLREEGKHYSALFKQASAIIAVSRDMEQQLLCLGAPREKLYYNPCGVDVSLFGGAVPESAPPLFVAVGRFVDKKAPHLTLLAFKIVAEAYPDARLLMIGDGPLLEACKHLAKAWGIEHAVEFRGARPHAEVAVAMQGARVFVQHSLRTSYGDSEGTPVAVLEAGATGLPVISTRHGGIVDVVIEGQTGLLVDEGDVSGMASQMMRLASDPQLAGRLGQAARERIQSEFGMEKSIAGLWSIIEGAIKRNAPR
jgi:colanic acid/amylovoran biosynthesis glycosyltransferase